MQERCAPRDDENSCLLSGWPFAMCGQMVVGVIVGCMLVLLVMFPLQVVCMMVFHQASEGTFLHHANWQHHQWLTSDLLTDENAGGITVEVILCKYSRQVVGVVKLKPLGGLLQTGSRAISEQVVAATFPMLLFSATA